MGGKQPVIGMGIQRVDEHAARGRVAFGAGVLDPRGEGIDLFQRRG